MAGISVSSAATKMSPHSAARRACGAGTAAKLRRKHARQHGDAGGEAKHDAEKIHRRQRHECRQHRLHDGGVGELLLEQRLLQTLQLPQRIAVGELRNRQAVPLHRQRNERHEDGEQHRRKQDAVGPRRAARAADDEAGQHGTRRNDGGRVKSMPSSRAPTSPAAISSAASNNSMEMTITRAHMNARGPAGIAGSEKLRQRARAARRHAWRDEQLQQQAAGAETDRYREAVVPPGEDAAGERQKESGRNRIRGDRQAAEHG